MPFVFRPHYSISRYLVPRQPNGETLSPGLGAQGCVDPPWNRPTIPASGRLALNLNPSPPSSLHWAVGALAAGIAALLCGGLTGCLVKDKPDKALTSGGMTPPWDPAKFLPKTLDGFAYAGPESLFTVFGDIARIDSLAGEPKHWKADPDGIDTLRVSQILDTSFVFPRHPEASMPYGYDDSFRDDTLYRSAFGNGLFMQDHPCAATIVLSGQFVHPAKWVRKGMKAEDITAALGVPLYAQGGVLRYLSHRPSPVPEREAGDTLSTAADYNAYEIFEGVNFYFRNDSLFAAVLQKSQPCH